MTMPLCLRSSDGQSYIPFSSAPSIRLCANVVWVPFDASMALSSIYTAVSERLFSYGA